MRAAPKGFEKPHPVEIIANSCMALEAASRQLHEAGWQTILLGADLEGDAATAGREHARLAKSYQKNASQLLALISGGELTVTVRNRTGRGGPNLEYLTGLMIGLEGRRGIEAIACDTDGVDGTEDNAGGYISSRSLLKAEGLRMNATACLEANNTYELFDALDDLVVTGPTRTNVNDFRIVLINPLD
jgi:hydroxypyruvate reductase